MTAAAISALLHTWVAAFSDAKKTKYKYPQSLSGWFLMLDPSLDQEGHVRGIPGVGALGKIEPEETCHMEQGLDCVK